MTASTYRPDIDGLRALAVLSVIFFHYGVPGASGGFVGVDVFFVISGYLITKNIVEALDEGTFSFKWFYLRRVRRLFPALFATVVATFGIGLLVLPAELLSALSKSTFATIFSLSNVLFWSEAGYFDQEAVTKPLLHTWSLSVEEQFYLVWPASLFLIAKFKSRALLYAVMTFVGLASLLFAQRWLKTDPTGAFFLSQFRGSEFMIGAAAVFLSRRKFVNPLFAEALALAGLLLILVPVATYSETTAFPGFNALAPCFGTALLICSGPTPLLGRLFVNRLAVGLGLISYSLYLVHWPLYVFYMFGKTDPISAVEQAGLVTVAIASAYLMYRYVEQPSRRPNASSILASHRTFAKLSAALAVSLAAVSAANAYTGGWGLQSLREDRELAKKLKGFERERFTFLKQVCGGVPGKPCSGAADDRKSFLIIGDSHGPDALNAFITAAPQFRYEISTTGGCPPLAPGDFRFIEKSHSRKACEDLARKRLDPDYLRRFSFIAINVNFGWYDATLLRHYVESVKAATEARIFIFGGFVNLKTPCGLIAPGKGLAKCFEAANIKSYRPHEDELKAMAQEMGLTFISKSEIFCGGGAVDTCRFVISGTPAIADGNHLTMLFAREMGTWIKQRYGDDLGLTTASIH